MFPLRFSLSLRDVQRQQPGGEKRFPVPDRLNVPQGTGIVDWKAVKAAADAQCDDVIYVVEREASYNDPQDRVACLAEDIAWLKANL